MTCEEAEIASGMRQHGALAPTETTALEAHLATCASCRAFAAMSRETERAMQARVMEEVGRIDWNTIGAGLQRLKQYDGMAWARTLVLVCVLTGFVAIKVPRAEMWVDLASTAVFGALIIAYRWWQTSQRAEALKAAQDSPLELLVIYRNLTETIVKQIRRRGVGTAVASVLFLHRGVSQWNLHGSSAQPLLLFAMAGVMMMVCAFTVRSHYRLRAEARELA